MTRYTAVPSSDGSKRRRLKLGHGVFETPRWSSSGRYLMVVHRGLSRKSSGDIEIVRIGAEYRTSDWLRFLETGAKLGARAILVVGADEEPGRLAQSYAVLEGKPAAEAMPVEAAPPGQTALFNNWEDAVECARCGGRMVRTGSCYTCRDCGTNTGCS